MNPTLPRESFYPFKTVIRPLAPPSWSEETDEPGWGEDREAITTFLDDLCREPLTRGLTARPAYRCLNDDVIDDLTLAMRLDGVAPARLDFFGRAVEMMRYIARERPFRCHEPILDAVLNLRAVFHVGGVVARALWEERAERCPQAARCCGGGAYCARHMVEDFLERRPALRDPAVAASRLDDMTVWGDEDFRRLVEMTALSPAACGRYAKTRAVRS